MRGLTGFKSHPLLIKTTKGSCRLRTAYKAAGLIDMILLSCDESSCFKDGEQLRGQAHLSRSYLCQEVRP